MLIFDGFELAEKTDFFIPVFVMVVINKGITASDNFAIH